MVGGPLAVVVTLTLGTLVGPLTADAQQAAKVPRIGVLHVGAPAAVSHLVEAFKQGLREHGYVEGQNIVVSAGSAKPGPSGYPRSPPNWCA